MDVKRYWLKEAKEALELRQEDRALDLIEKNALKRDASINDMREAYWLAKQIEGGRGPHGVKVRAERAASHLSRYVDPLGFVSVERQNSAQIDARKRALRAIGLNVQRAEALAQLQGGSYDVVLAGLPADCDRQAIRAVLGQVGYPRKEIELLLERVEHIAPEPIAHLLHQSAAVRIKVALESAGAKVRIKAHQ